MNKHIATDPAGVEHTRNSKTRVYSHTVVVRIDGAKRLANNLADLEADYVRRNYDHDFNRVARYSFDKPEEIDRNREEFRAQYPTFEEYLKICKQRVIASHNKWLNAGGPQHWLNAGWCGRLDLAQKLADKERGGRNVAEVVILEAKLK